MTVAALLASSACGTSRRSAYSNSGRGSSSRPLAAPLSLEDDGSASSTFRLVLPREKRDRLAERALQMQWRRCSVADCTAESMPVLLVDAELEALLCPVHQLVLLDGSAVAGEPMLATSAW